MTRIIRQALSAALFLPFLAAAGRTAIVRAELKIIGQGVSPGLTLSVPYRAEGLGMGIAPTLTPLPLSINAGAREIWRGNNVRIDLALPGPLAQAETLSIARLRDPKHGAFQAAVFTQIGDRLEALGEPAQALRLASKAFGAAAAEPPRAAPLEDLARIFENAPTSNPNPNNPRVLDRLFDGRVSSQAQTLSALGVGAKAPQLEEAARRIVKMGGALQAPQTHPEIRSFLMETSVFATVMGAKPATRIPRTRSASGSYLHTDEGVAALSATLARLSPELQLLEAGPQLVVFDIAGVARVMLDDAFGVFDLWEPAIPADRRQAYRQAVMRLLNPDSLWQFRVEEGALFGFPVTAVMEFAARHTSSDPTHTVRIVSEFGADDIAWSTFTPLTMASPTQILAGDNLAAIVWYDSVVALARHHLGNLIAKSSDESR